MAIPCTQNVAGITDMPGFIPTPLHQRYRTCGRHAQSGVQLGVLEANGLRGFTVVMQLDDGSVKTFAPDTLQPEYSFAEKETDD